MDLIIAGESPVAVDLVGSETMGLSIDKVKNLKYREQKEFVTANLDEIEIVDNEYHKILFFLYFRINFFFAYSFISCEILLNFNKLLNKS
jgi:hypothetical protein